MKLNFRLIYILLLNLIYIGFMVYLIYAIWMRNVSWICIFLVLAMFFRLPTMVTAYSRYSEEPDDYSLDLAIQPVLNQEVTPEFITEILRNENVIQVIRNDLMKTGQIGYREEWRLGLISPGQDMVNLNISRTAVLHSSDAFWHNNIAVTNGLIRPLNMNKWAYSFQPKLNRGEFIHFRNMQLEVDGRVCTHSHSFPKFLKENGFPLKDSYADGDPLTADRGGTIILDRDKLMVIYPHYFIQRRLIDDEGNLVDLGIDEDLRRDSSFSVKMIPSVSRLLIRRVSDRGYTPVVRYHTVPYASDTMLPILDTPMSANGWADLYIDTRGKGKLFIAKEKTVSEWNEMMIKLRQLFYSEMAKKDYHLLDLTKDKSHLNHYLSQKQNILADYYLIQDFSQSITVGVPCRQILKTITV